MQEKRNHQGKFATEFSDSRHAFEAIIRIFTETGTPKFIQIRTHTVRIYTHTQRQKYICTYNSEEGRVELRTRLSSEIENR